MGGVPTALVLSAGGMFGAGEVGVWLALRDRVQFDLIVGASAGAWVGWCIACGMPTEELVRHWKDPGMAHIMRVGLHRSGWLRHEVLHERARELAALGPPRIP